MKIICVGRNYKLHALELGNKVPEKPLIFIKPDSAVLRESNPLYYPSFTSDLHYEVEVILKVCKKGKHIAPEFTHLYYDEISLGIDFTARDIQSKLKEKGHPWEIAKGFDHSACIGTWKKIEQFDINNTSFALQKNGIEVQTGNTKDMIFDISTLISYISKIFTLKLGDIIFTGTPAGVGPVEMGDHLEGFLEGEKLLDCRVK